MPESFSISAPAKINLSLAITGQRDDGYHSLNSLVVFADIADSISFSIADKTSIAISGEFKNSVDPDNNSVLSALKAMKREFALPALKIDLIKNLPAGAGIGGGSSDAAATLLLLRNKFCQEASIENLDNIALALGADVPVCLRRKPCLMSGIGERIKPLSVPDIYLVLVNPNIHISTAKIFGMGFQSFSTAAELVELKGFQELVSYLKQTGNDLQKNAIAHAPEIEEALGLIRQEGSAFTAMSGSGSTCFGIFDDYGKACKTAENISRIKKGWWVKPASLFKE